MPDNVFLGFDGGGTKTEAVLLDAAGTELARALSGPSNPLRVGFDAAFESLTFASRETLRIAGAAPENVRAVCAGLAGAGRPAVIKLVEPFLQKMFPQALVHVTADFTVALEAAAGDGPGVVLIAGTGSIAYGRNDLGQQARAGGRGVNFAPHGEFVVDEGSGLDIGLRAMRAVINPFLFWRRWTPLARKMKEASGLDVGLLKGAEVCVELAALVPLVVEAARENDARARGILEGAADALAGLAVDVLRQLDLLGAEVGVAASGGVFKESPEVFARVQAQILKAAPKVRVELLAVSPAEGAARLAQRLWLQEQTPGSA